MKRETENTVLLLVGVSVAMIAATGAYTRYVKPGLLPWLAISAALLIGLALTAITRDIRRGPREGDEGHAHRGGIVWLLVLPIVLLIFVVPPALSARAAAPSMVATGTDAARRPFPPLPAGRAPAVSLPELLMRIATDSTASLHDRLITVTGFTMKEADHTDLARIVIVCCAADAQLARVHLDGPAARAAAGLPDATWVSVEGTVPAGQTYSGASSIPTFQVSTVVRIDPPSTPYGN
jgi:uncharacterized repeat protein (TIGR03943 family)